MRISFFVSINMVTVKFNNKNKMKRREKMLIEVKGLSKTFKVKQKKGMFQSQESLFQAVDNVDFQIERGEMVAFIGPNGAGKSTTIKMLTGIIQPTSGSMIVDGLDPSKDRKKLAYKIGCMFGQKSQLYMHLSVIDSLRLIGSIYDMSKKEVEERIEEIGELFEINHLLEQTVRKLSLGQRMICEISASILHNPDIIFLDEPTIGLDIVAKLRIREIISNLNKMKNTTVFLTSHDVSDVEALCSRMMIIHGGKIVTDTSIENLRASYLNKKKLVLLYDKDMKDSRFNHLPAMCEGNKVMVSVDTSKENIGEVLEELVSLGNVLDIQINSLPLEDIIKNIYERNN